jgi:hypothetical protein
MNNNHYKTFKMDKEEEEIINEEYDFIDINSANEYEIEGEKTEYPSKPDIGQWKEYLNRQLTMIEDEYVENYTNEIFMNMQIKTLYENVLENGYFIIPQLTNINQNSFWESLSHLGFGTSNEIRKNIAVLLLLKKDDYDFFPKLNTCPEEMFFNNNSTLLVRDKYTYQIYNYDYNMMIIDLYSNYSWYRLPTELILLAVSKLYQININIFSNKTKQIQKISAYDDEEETIYLGCINDSHYIPIKKLDDDLSKNTEIAEELIRTYPVYISSQKIYKKWASTIKPFQFNTNYPHWNNHNSNWNNPMTDYYNKY